MSAQAPGRDLSTVSSPFRYDSRHLNAYTGPSKVLPHCHASSGRQAVRNVADLAGAFLTFRTITVRKTIFTCTVVVFIMFGVNATSSSSILRRLPVLRCLPRIRAVRWASSYNPAVAGLTPEQEEVSALYRASRLGSLMKPSFDKS